MPRGNQGWTTGPNSGRPKSGQRAMISIRVWPEEKTLIKRFEKAMKLDLPAAEQSVEALEAQLNIE